MTESKSSDPLGVLSAGPVGVSSPDEVHKARMQMVPWLEDQVALLPERRRAHRNREYRRKMALFGGAMAAAAVAMLAFFTSAESPDARVAEATASAPASSSSEPEEYATLLSGRVMSGSVDLLVGSRLGLSSRVETGKEEGATLQASGGYQLSLSPETEVAFIPTDSTKGSSRRVLRLYQGVVALSVSPLPQGSVLSVQTDDAKVTVVGTQFSVEAHAGGVTCVRVISGQVKVERASGETVLSGGESSGCEGVDDSEATLSGKPARSLGERTLDARGSSTTLEHENQLLATALSQERQGRSVEARTAYEDLLRKYPHSSFAQDARAGIKRLTVKK